MIVALFVTAALAKPRAEDVEEGLPGWMTHGEEVRLEITKNLLESGNTIGALDVLRLMRADGFDGPQLDLYQGVALRMDGVTSEAERLLTMAQKRMHDDPRPSAELCILFADERRLDEAIQACERATRLDPNGAAAHNNLAFLLLSAGRYDEALAAAETAVSLDAGDAIYRNNLGLVQASLGREDAAFRTLQSTMPKADAAYMVGIAVEKVSGREAATPWFERALSLSPDHSLTREHLSRDVAPSTPVDGEPKETP